MVAMSENDSIPSLENLVNDKAAWLYFCPWYKNYLMSEQNNPTENLKEIYNSEYCITLDELPDIRTYKSGEDPTSATTAASTAEALLKGDANCEGRYLRRGACFAVDSE